MIAHLISKVRVIVKTFCKFNYNGTNYTVLIVINYKSGKINNIEKNITIFI